VQLGPEAETVTDPGKAPAVNSTLVPVLTFNVPYWLFTDQLSPLETISTSSATPIVVRVRSVGDVAAVSDAIVHAGGGVGSPPFPGPVPPVPTPITTVPPEDDDEEQSHTRRSGLRLAAGCL